MTKHEIVKDILVAAIQIRLKFYSLSKERVQLQLYSFLILSANLIIIAISSLV